MNQFRSKAFIKIKHSIKSANNALHLQTCRDMLDCAKAILSKDEITILQEYLLEAWDILYPVNNGDDQMLNVWHSKTCGFNHN